ncbi:ATP-binding protein [Pleionea sediminis]|uniref:ATP-binding protein n=1 Tax=Pleionea sediminis TaxID=2569479 RepID=UPI0013DE18D3|nr:ATP-binding protein [Pleionea sediminis]
MILANLVVIAAIYFLSNWSLSASFKEYLDANRAQTLGPLIQALSQNYQREEGWQWLNRNNHDAWRDLVDTYYLSKNTRQPRNNHRVPRPQAHDRPFRGDRRPPPPTPPPTPPKLADMLSPRLLLADKNKRLLIGRQTPDTEIVWLEIMRDDQIIGFLGYHATNEITDELDRLFIDKLKLNFLWSLLIIIAISGLVTFFLSRILVQPIITLRRLVHKLGKGDFSEEIKVHQKDELGELSDDINRMAKSLDKNLNARQQWVADISHELRTPVSILQGELEALLDGVRPLSSQAIVSLHQEVKRLNHLINDLHELSMSDIGALNYRFEETNLINIVDEVISSQKNRLSKKLIIEHFKPDKPTIIKGDEQRLTQLFLNLLNNSLSYCNHPGKVEIKYSIDNSNICITWSDSSPGVTENQLEKLFERLYRIDESRNRNTGGSGLGLSIVRNIVEAHGGSIEATHSSLGGVSFKINLPL